MNHVTPDPGKIGYKKYYKQTGKAVPSKGKA